MKEPMNQMRSLRVPRNPLARLQELEAEMAPAVAAGSSSAAGHPETARSSDARTHAPTDERTSGHTRAATDERTSGRANAATQERTKEPDGAEKAALTQLLATPLEPGLLHGPFQAGTVRMPTELWKRVGWIASFTGRTKQDIIGEALWSYLERLRNEAR
jgi:hypothetical protein